MTEVGAAADLPGRAARIGATVAAGVAADVDRQARFPREALDALRADGLLSVLVPARLDGAGASITQVADGVVALGRHCGSTAMIFAMHQVQVACLARHGGSDRYLKEIVADQPLLASATTEDDVGGDLRTSLCAVERHGDRFRLEKRAPVVSYGEFADAVLATARRSPDSRPADQVLVLCRPPGLTMDRTSAWDTLGLRGTCSPGFRLRAEGDEEDVLPTPFADIATQTMVPVAHILWSGAWLGIATAAVDRASRFVRAEARKHPGSQAPGAARLAELVGRLQLMTELVRGTARRYDVLADDREAVSGLSFAIGVNSLKVQASELVVDIVGRAMTICGVAGYREDSPYSLGRLLRDAYGATVMVNNDRILANNAHMLQVHKPDRW